MLTNHSSTWPMHLLSTVMGNLTPKRSKGHHAPPNKRPKAPSPPVPPDAPGDAPSITTNTRPTKTITKTSAPPSSSESAQSPDTDKSAADSPPDSNSGLPKYQPYGTNPGFSGRRAPPTQFAHHNGTQFSTIDVPWKPGKQAYYWVPGKEIMNSVHVIGNVGT